MGRKLIDLTGKRFSYLTVVSYLGREHHSSVWRCICDCGSEAIVHSAALNSGTTKSCGCFRKTRMGSMNLKHGRSDSDEYKVWDGMRQRCCNPNAPGWEYYGGRGIKVCDRWSSFESFFADMGERPSSKHSIDRFPNVNGSYEPGNCRWATWSQQARNRSNNRVTGVFPSLIDAAESAGLPYKIVKSRIGHGWSVEEALRQPIGVRKSCSKK